MALHNPAQRCELVSSSENTREKCPRGFMHESSGRAAEVGMLVSCGPFPPFFLPIGFTLDAVWRMSQITSLSQRKGGDHLPEKHQGYGCDWRWSGWDMFEWRQETRPWPKLRLGSEVRAVLGTTLGESTWSQWKTRALQEGGFPFPRASLCVT